MDQILKIADFIIKSFIHIWPYLLVTIPLAVVINLSGASKYINRAFSKKPMVSIFLATLVGAFSPFCSCGVIPVITSLLIGGVPLGPVMAFWIASPSMDPEIFMLSVATIGWKLSVWRLAATFVISIAGGIITHLAQKNGFFGESVLRTNRPLIPEKVRNGLFFQKSRMVQLSAILPKHSENVNVNCCVTATELVPVILAGASCQCSDPLPAKKPALAHRILTESWKSFSLVAKFMALAFLINALIRFYVPDNLISGWIGGDSPFSVLIAALIGIPFYTTNLTALPLVSGLITLGMNPGAVLAFLIAGPVTTLPAMMAVWGIVKPKVFFMFLTFGLVGSVFFGYLYNLIY
jgi:uncharacterized membrane protein YraQ (UPF0718 family)